MALGGERSLEETSSLVVALRALRERWWIIVLCVVVLGVAAGARSATQDDSYEASATLLIGSQGTNVNTLVDPTAQATGIDQQRELATAQQLVTSQPVVNRVRKALNLPPGQSVPDGSVVVAAEPETSLLRVTAANGDPVLARRVANTFAQQYVSYQRQSDVGNLEAAQTALTNQINALPAQSVSQRAVLADALAKVTALRLTSNGNAQIISLANTPQSRVSPTPKRDIALGLIIGLVVGVAAVFVVDLFDRRLKDPEAFEGIYGFRALATVAATDSDPTTQRERAAALEPFRILRNGLPFLAPGQEIRTILVTSAVQGEGKSTVASGLARAYALSGSKVVLVECDLRRPTFHEQFDLGGESRGLTTALVGRTPVRELLRRPLSGLRTLAVLPSGPVPPNSAELLRSATMTKVLEALLAEVDIVILDAPPLLPVADAQVLLDNATVDAAIVVGRAFKTTRDEARRTAAVLERHAQERFGLVVNGLRRGDGEFDYYGSVEEEKKPPSKNGGKSAKQRRLTVQR